MERSYTCVQVFLTSQMVAHRFKILFAIPLTQRGAVTMKILTVPWYRTHSNGPKKNKKNALA